MSAPALLAAAVPPPTAPTPGYFQRDYSDNAGAPGGAFDDIVTWLSPNDLISPLVKDGAMQSATGQWADELNNIKNYVTAQLLSCQLPSSLPTQYQTDPWGNNTNYARSFTSSIDSSIVAASSAAAR